MKVLLKNKFPYLQLLKILNKIIHQEKNRFKILKILITFRLILFLLIHIKVI